MKKFELAPPKTVFLLRKTYLATVTLKWGKGEAEEEEEEEGRGFTLPPLALVLPDFSSTRQKKLVKFCIWSLENAENINFQICNHRNFANFLPSVGSRYKIFNFQKISTIRFTPSLLPSTSPPLSLSNQMMLRHCLTINLFFYQPNEFIHPKVQFVWYPAVGNNGY